MSDIEIELEEDVWFSYLDHSLHNNFPKEKFLIGRFHNHELRQCLSDEFIQFLKNNPSVKLHFTKFEIDKNKFLDENNIHYYQTGNEYDYA